MGAGRQNDSPRLQSQGPIDSTSTSLESLTIARRSAKRVSVNRVRPRCSSYSGVYRTSLSELEICAFSATSGGATAHLFVIECACVSLGASG